MEKARNFFLCDKGLASLFPDGEKVNRNRFIGLGTDVKVI
jgi:hypothetical protein